MADGERGWSIVVGIEGGIKESAGKIGIRGVEKAMCRDWLRIQLFPSGLPWLSRWSW